MNTLAEFPSVPIVGKPFEVLAHHSVAMIQCGCSVGWPLLLGGVGRIAECPACHKKYAIAKAANLTIGIVSETQGVVVPEPS